MDKRAVENFMPLADDAIRKTFKDKDGKIVVDSTYRSKMSAFGAAVIMSGLLPALAYYQKNEDKIIKLLEYMYKEYDKKYNELDDTKENSIFEIAKDEKNKDNLKELILNFSISLKLVMNLYIQKG